MPNNRIDDEDDEMAVIEQDVQRLVIVTQVLLFISQVHTSLYDQFFLITTNNLYSIYSIFCLNVQNGDPKKETGGSKESKTISNELASQINDGLYFYEQVETPFLSSFSLSIIDIVLHHFHFIKLLVAPSNFQQELIHNRRSNRRKSNSNNKERTLKSQSHTSGASNINAGENAVGSVEESGGNNSRRKPKVFHKHQSSLTQRFFSSNFRNHGTGRNSHGVISESPPSNSVGFFFSSTPPENHRSVQNDCSSS